MFGRDTHKRNVKSIATPLLSFGLLGALVVGAVIFGTLVVERADGCRPLGMSAENDSPTLIVFSDDDDGLMLCDVPQETVAYIPPQRSEAGALIGKAMLRLRSGEEVVMPDSLMTRVDGNDLERIDPGILLYKKGEFGEVEDCYGDSYSLEDGEGIWNADPFGVYSDPESIQSCWLEIETFTDTDIAR